MSQREGTGFFVLSWNGAYMGEGERLHVHCEHVPGEHTRIDDAAKAWCAAKAMLRQWKRYVLYHDDGYTVQQIDAYNEADMPADEGTIAQRFLGLLQGAQYR